jgi:hypothetical protein
MIDVSMSESSVESTLHEAVAEEKEKHVPERPEQEHENGQTTIVQRESKQLLVIRLFFLLLLIVFAVGVAVGAFFYVSGTEQDDFEYKFRSSSSKVLEAIGITLDQTLGSIDAFASGMVSIAKSTNQSWPFVTIPNFAVRAAKILDLSKGVVIISSMFVSHSNRELWQNYSLKNDWWVDETISVQEKALNRFYFGEITKEWEPYGVIHDDFGDSAPDDAWYFPTWQIYPVVYRNWPLYNWNYGTFAPFSQQAGIGVTMHHVTGISAAYMLPDPTNAEEVASWNVTAEWYRDYITPDRNPLEPMSDIYYVSVYFSLSL